MNRAERKGVKRVVRAAIDGTAAEVGSGELAPLHLTPRAGMVSGAVTGPGNQAPGPVRARARSGLSRPVAAIAAAAAVLALAAASIGAASVLRADRQDEMTRTRQAAGPLSLIPRYFVELDHGSLLMSRPAKRALVVDSMTGKVLASFPVPKPYTSFAAVAAAADDRTFVLAAVDPSARRLLQSELLVLRIRPRPAGVSAALNQIGLNIPVNWQGRGLALSPDGTRLAFAASPVTRPIVTRVWAFSMVNGTVRSWQDNGEVGSFPWDGRSLSWSPDDRTLAYLWGGNAQLNLLNAGSAGGSLLAHSRRLIRFTPGRHPTRDADLTPDGKKVIASMNASDGGRIDEFSAANGKLIASRTPAALGGENLYDVLWTNASGSLMIIELNTPTGVSDPVRLLHGGKLTDLKGISPISEASDLAW